MDKRLDAKMVPLGGGLYEQVRFFGDAQIQKAVDDALKGVSVDKKGVVLHVDVDGEGVRAVLAARPRKNWTIGVIGEIDRNKDYKLGARVAFEW